MTTAPDFDSFAKCYERGESQVVWTRLVSDLETPVSAMLKLARDGHYCFLLESVEGGAVRGRYSMIGVRPDQLRRARVIAAIPAVGHPEAVLAAARSGLVDDIVLAPELAEQVEALLG